MKIFLYICSIKKNPLSFCLPPSSQWLPTCTSRVENQSRCSGRNNQPNAFSMATNAMSQHQLAQAGLLGATPTRPLAPEELSRREAEFARAKHILVVLTLLVESAVSDPVPGATFLAPFEGEVSERRLFDVLTHLVASKKDITTWDKVLSQLRALSKKLALLEDKLDTADFDVVNRVIATHNELIKLATKVRRTDVVSQFVEAVGKSDSTDLPDQDNVYLGAIVRPGQFRDQTVKIGDADYKMADVVSNHITLAFAKDEVLSRLHELLGKMVEVEVADEAVLWTHEDEETHVVEQYAYLPCKVAFEDGTLVRELPTHISLKVPGEKGGKEFFRNALHQQGLFKTKTTTTVRVQSVNFTSIMATLAKKNACKKVLSVDFDNTVFDIERLLDTAIAENPGKTRNEVFMDVFHNLDLITKDHLTDFGKFVRDMCRDGVKVQITTSRTWNKDVAEKMIGGDEPLFPGATLSFATVAFKGNYEEEEKALTKAQKEAQKEAQKKKEKAMAVDKRKRVPHGLTHVDDVQVVCETTPFSLLITKGKNLTYVKSTPPPVRQVVVALHGPVGAGKTTLVNTSKHFIELLGYQVIAGGPDSFWQTPKAVASFSAHILANGQKVCFIWDTTGRRPDKTVATTFVYLMPESGMDATTFLGCYASVMGRRLHSTLAGSVPTSLEEVQELLDERDSEPSLTNTNGMGMVQLVRELLALFKGNIRAVADLFHANNHKQRVDGSAMVDGTTYTASMVSYREGSQRWGAKWGLQARNAGLFTDSDGNVTVVKSGLPVGKELATLETKSVAKYGDAYSSRSIDPTQAWLTSILAGLSPEETTELEAWVTSKRDGCLGQLTFVPPPLVPVYRELYADNPFALLCLEHSIMVSSNGTIAAPKPMWDLIVSAVAEQMGLTMETLMEKSAGEQLPKDVLDWAEAQTETETWTRLFKAWSYLCPLFATECDVLHKASGANSTVSLATLQFEMTVANRTTMFFEDIHTELATVYSKGGVAFLGITYYADDGNHVVLPHYETRFQEHLAKSFLDQPLAWKVTTTAQIHEMLRALVEYAFGRLTVKEFLARFPPCVHGALEILDLEGFILYVLMPNGLLTYNKLKTSVYYLAHSVDLEKVQESLDLIEDAEDGCSLLKEFPLMADLKTWATPSDGVDVKASVKGAFEHTKSTAVESARLCLGISTDEEISFPKSVHGTTAMVSYLFQRYSKAVSKADSKAGSKAGFWQKQAEDLLDRILPEMRDTISKPDLFARTWNKAVDATKSALMDGDDHTPVFHAVLSLLTVPF